MSIKLNQSLLEMVYNILSDRKYEYSRNNDIYLAVTLWRVYYNAVEYIHGEQYIKVNELFKIPSYDTITRARRYLQSKHKHLLPSDVRVAKKRRIHEETWRKAMACRDVSIFNKIL